MTLRPKTGGEALNAVYMTWTESEFPKDGEKFMLLAVHPSARPRAAEPYVIIPQRPDLVIKPENSSSFVLVATTETGRVNLEFDGFHFEEGDGTAQSQTN